MFNVSEASTITHEKLKISDQNSIKELCNYVDKSILEDENEITKIQRFEKKKENANRPIRISVNKENRNLENCINLKIIKSLNKSASIMT